MPQNPPTVFIAKSPQGYSVPLQSDLSGNLLVGSGQKTLLNITAATVVKTGPGRIVRLSVLATSAFTINDCATVAAAGQANAIYTSPVGGALAGTIITLDCPLTTGLVVAAAGAIGLSISYS